MLRTALEGKHDKRVRNKSPITRTIDIVQDDDSDKDSDKDSAEDELEEMVFGSSSSKRIDALRVRDKPVAKRQRRHTDDSESSDDAAENVDEGLSQKKPAWVDEDDENIRVKDKVDVMRKGTSEMWADEQSQYSEHLKKKYTKLMGVPRWAEQQETEALSEEEDEMLLKVGTYVGQSAALAPSVLDIHKCPALNSEGKVNTILKSVEFHPGSQVALTAGFSGTVNIYQVDGKVNPKIQAVHFEQFPIHSAHFSRDGREILLGSSQQEYMYAYDMMAGKTTCVRFPKGLNLTNTKHLYISPDGEHFVVCGRFGTIHLFSMKSKECLDTLKMNSEVKSAAFNDDGSVMYTLGGNEICVWDMKSRRCKHRFYDHGCVSGSSLAASPNGQYLASGSDSGVVNVYETSALLGTRYPTPVKELMNLTTEVTQLCFNFTSELLAMSSSFKASAVKMVHFPSLTVFSNFPAKHDLKYSNCIDISPHSGYFACGNNMGTAHLFRLKHYSNF